MTAPRLSRSHGGRLFDVFRGPTFTLLAFSGAASRYGDSIRVHHVGPAESEVRRIYGVDHGYVLIRPDGYVGLIAQAEAAVRDYLQLVTGGM